MSLGDKGLNNSISNNYLGDDCIQNFQLDGKSLALQSKIQFYDDILEEM